MVDASDKIAKNLLLGNTCYTCKQVFYRFQYDEYWCMTDRHYEEFPIINTCELYVSGRMRDRKKIDRNRKA